MKWPQLMGILNIAPDSFSDGGEATEVESALRKLEKLVAEGADVVDIGAESTRPGASLLSPQQEQARLLPLLGRLRERPPQAALSVDTRHASTAHLALKHGFSWVNDVSAGSDPDMPAVIAAFPNCRYIFMHAMSVPPVSGEMVPEHDDIVEHLLAFAGERLAILLAAGVEPRQLVLDPGFGFGKSPAQTMELVRRLPELAVLQLPILVGHSRKSFLTHFAETPAAERDGATLALSLQLAKRSADFLRVHAVGLHKQAFAVMEAFDV